MTLPMMIACVRTTLTRTPRVSAASGVSPTARTLSPKVVRFMANHTTGTSANAT